MISSTIRSGAPDFSSEHCNSPFRVIECIQIPHEIGVLLMAIQFVELIKVHHFAFADNLINEQDG
jgi:hypothetical protein